MAQFRARIMAADRGTEETYDFTAEDDLMVMAPEQVARVFFEAVEMVGFPRHDLVADIDAAFRRTAGGREVVTAMGSIHLDGHAGPPMPFMVMISAA